VLQVRANPATATVLVIYDSGRVSARAVLQTLRRHPWFPAEQGRPKRARPREGVGVKQRVAESLVASLLELTVRGVVTALV
jgi:hypothetical protein